MILQLKGGGGKKKNNKIKHLMPICGSDQPTGDITKRDGARVSLPNDVTKQRRNFTAERHHRTLVFSGMFFFFFLDAVFMHHQRGVKK